VSPFANGGYLYTTDNLSVVPGPFAIGDDQPISRAMVARMLALTFYDSGTIHALERVHPFSDSEPDDWFDPYVNAVYLQGIMRGDGRRFIPNAPLTLRQTQRLLEILSPDNHPTLAITSDDRPVSYALWVELYKKLLENLSEGRTVHETFGVTGENIIVLATSGNSFLPAGRLISDQGAFGHLGTNMDGYIDQQIRALVKGREIIALDTMISERPTLLNAYIVDVNREGLSVFLGGVERFYTFTNFSNAQRRDIQPGTVADIVIGEGRVFAVQPFSEVVQGKLLRVSDSLLELQGLGAFPMAEGFKVYDISNGSIQWRGQAQLIVGTDNARFYIHNGEARAGVITHHSLPEEIRVVIGTSNFAGLIHTRVTVTSATSFWVTAGDTVTEFAPGQRFTVSDIENTDLFGEARVFIHTVPGGTLQLTGLGRNWPNNSSPRYRGIIEIAREAGGYSVVNQLSLEEYLYAVVPSEMPSSYGVEASKVQAITARSYAINQMWANRFHALGGNVDDSVYSQVYNNIPENEVSIQAVDGTQGMVLTYNGQVINATFFSTSAGMTANSGEVWAGGGFPGNTPSYLSARPQFEGAVPNLTNEAQAAAFFRNLEIEAFDREASWFRWRVEMTAEEIANSVNTHLATRYRVAPNLIRSRQPNGEWRSRPVSNIGRLLDLSVVSRGEGGNITELRITGDEADIIVATELNIRNLLRPARAEGGERDIPIHRWDGTTVTNLSLMPSAFFTFEIIVCYFGLPERVIFYGGGHGHGVGMSQNGVHGMVERGYDFREILQHFYPGIYILATQ